MGKHRKTGKAREPRAARKAPEIAPSTCFMIMPFDEGRKKIYDEAIKPAVEASGYQCFRADELSHPGNIIRDIVVGLSQADLVIADLTDANPNVFYELGVAHSLGTPCVLLTQKIAVLPFDLASYRVIRYVQSIQGVRKLRHDLKKAIRVSNEAELSNPVLDTLMRGDVVARGLRVKALLWHMPFEALSIDVAGNYREALPRMFPHGVAQRLRDAAVEVVQNVLPRGALEVEWRGRPMLGDWNQETGCQSLDWWPRKHVLSEELEDIEVQFDVLENARRVSFYFDPNENTGIGVIPSALRKQIRSAWFDRFAEARTSLEQLLRAMLGQRASRVVLELHPCIVEDSPKHVEFEWCWEVRDQKAPSQRKRSSHR